MSFPYTSVTSSTVTPTERLSGDYKLLSALAGNGFNNKDTFIKTNQALTRPDINVPAILENLISEANTAPVMITGPEGSGKSTLMSQLGKHLQDKGYPVVTIDGESSELFHHNTFNQIIDKIDTARQPGQKTFVMLDGLATTAIMDSKSEFIRNNPAAGTLYKLEQYLAKNPHVQVISTMMDDPFEGFIDQLDAKQLAKLETLFPVSNRITVKAIDALGPKTALDMVDSALKYAGYDQIPTSIRQTLEKLNVKLNPRQLLNTLSMHLGLTEMLEGPVIGKQIPQAVWDTVVKLLK